MHGLSQPFFHAVELVDVGFFKLDSALAGEAYSKSIHKPRGT